MAVFVKVYALVLLPWLALALGLPAVLGFMAVLAAGLLLPIPVYGWDGNLALLAGWYHTVTSTTAPNLLLRHAISFAAMWAKWLGPGTLASVLALASVIVAWAAAGLCGGVESRWPIPGISRWDSCCCWSRSSRRRAGTTCSCSERRR